MKLLKYIFTLIIIGITIKINAQINFPLIEGWNKSDETQTYTDENLWEYINGAATYYLKYHFEKLEIAEYSVSPQEYIYLEIYQHKSPIDAFGIYAFERPDKTNFINIGTEGYIEESNLNFYGDLFYVKIIASKNTKESLDAMKKLAALISQEIIHINELPSILKKFPKEGMIQHTEKYYPENYLGHEFLHSAIEVSYKTESNFIRLFIIEGNDKNEIKEIAKSYFSNTKLNKNPKENTIYKLDDLFNGTIYILLNDKYLFGTVDISDNEIAKKYLMQLSK